MHFPHVDDTRAMDPLSADAPDFAFEPVVSCVGSPDGRKPLEFGTHVVASFHRTGDFACDHVDEHLIRMPPLRPEHAGLLSGNFDPDRPTEKMAPTGATSIVDPKNQSTET